jgi:hypothetical protein
MEWFSRPVFLPSLSDDAKWFVRGLYFVLYSTFSTFAVLFIPQTTDAKRTAKYLQQTTETRRNIPYLFKTPRLFKNRIPFIFMFVGLLLIYVSNVQDLSGFASKLNWSEIRIGTATALSGLLWSATVGFIWYRGVGRLGLIRRAPDLALIRILADAFTSVIEAKPHGFRSFALRAKLSAYLRSAANLLDGQMASMLAGGDKLAEGIVLPQLAGAAAGLRQKLGSLAMPVQNTREEIARLLGDALIAVASGNLAALPSAEAAALPGGPALWRSRLEAFLRWCVIGLAPGLALSFGWSLIPDAGLRGLLVQFAALCFVTATFSAIDPDGRNKLASVVSTGTGLFGWGKGKD